MASSASVGRRPRISRIRAYSSSLRPSSRYGWSRSGVASASLTVSDTDEPLQHGGEEPEPGGGRAGEGLDRVLGVRHQADHVAPLVGDARDAAVGPGGVVTDVPDDDP